MRAALAAAALALAAPRLPAHEATRATIVVSPQHPRVGRACRVEVTLRTVGGLARSAQRAWIVGEMTGHPMRPVEAELRRGAGDVDFVGELDFTMEGPWLVTLRVQDGGSVLWAPLEWQVVGEGDDPGASRMGQLVDLREPVPANLLPPGWAAAGALGLVFAMQRGAVLLRRRRARAGPG